MKSLLVIMAIVVVLWGSSVCGFFCFMKPLPIAPSLKGAGLPMPGYFAAINALFSGLAFGAVFWTLRSQQSELRLDRIRSEFSQTLGAYHTALRDVQWDGKHGVQAVLGLENALLGEVDSKGNLKPGKLGKYFGALRNNSVEPLDDSVIQSTFETFIEREAGGSMAHLFRMQSELPRIASDAERLKIIDEARANEIIGVYRSALSDPELHLMLYYGLSRRAPSWYRGLIEKYGLLNGLLLKEKPFVLNRIPEIQRHPKTYELRKWKG